MVQVEVVEGGGGVCWGTEKTISALGKKVRFALFGSHFGRSPGAYLQRYVTAEGHIPKKSTILSGLKSLIMVALQSKNVATCSCRIQL